MTEPRLIDTTKEKRAMTVSYLLPVEDERGREREREERRER